MSAALGLAASGGIAAAEPATEAVAAVERAVPPADVSTGSTEATGSAERARMIARGALDAGSGASSALGLGDVGGAARLAAAMEGELQDAADALAAFYAARAHAPVWFAMDGASEAGRDVMAHFERAHEDGLDPAAYAVDADGPFETEHDLARAEIALAEAIVAYAGHAQAGRVDPSAISALITVKPERPEPRAILEQVAGQRDPAAALAGFHPPHEGYRALKDALASLRERERTREERITVPEGRLLRRGMRDTRVAALRTRLGVTSDADQDVYDPALEEAVRAYQRDQGLGVDGVVGPRTLAMLNAGPAEREAAILANMERWRWLPRTLGARHVVVNVPAYRVRVVADGQEAYSGRVVVGTPDNQTPIFSHAISHIVANPYWNVPRSIAVGEMLPQLRANPYALSARGFEVLYEGRLIDPGRVDWHRIGSNFPFRLRQKPGPNNALGRVKFMFPNEHAVYLHDTPQRSLFERVARAFSHGCVRLAEPFVFAEALLADEPDLSAARVEGMLGGKERWLTLKNEVPVYLTYFTVEADSGDDIRVHDDLYGHDRRLRAALGLDES